ncbi:3'-5' exoribonuclease [Thauera sp. CAU 1555]|uniref:DNA-directed DNA polymerase n=1 Tax=Thauera sedimentorum TaxID=2767595 RepID=A0ABR9B8T6_9RHOO|nr:3'-5' exonuclease family protein [Thauera sedimentorum]MBC9071852.1 3'-5' exoribonuclease [Thauera sedimentorum]MBD8502771.1 3'-5' exoribonuclease [Thauera sedimentorum]
MFHGCTCLSDGLAFVDIETTGGPAQRASITEIAVVEVDDSGVRQWSTLVQPQMRIPEHIERLTGISNAMVANAPRFEAIADELFDRLDGRIFVAHNARFDHGHIKAAFRRMGVTLRPRVLCTVKLSRRLFPQERRHSLDHLIARHRLEVLSRHRALGDALALWQFWQRLHDHFPAGQIEAVARELIGRPALPPYLDPAEVDALPDAPGVYLFYGENDIPLYIGKSTRLRSRVLSHFSADHESDRELSLSQQVRRIDHVRTAGEFGALLEEARLIKRLQPILNRQLRRNRELCAWRFEQDLAGDAGLSLVQASEIDFRAPGRLYGFFRNRRDAQQRLRSLCAEHALCPPLLGLEKHTPGRCFTHQLKRCHGACLGLESYEKHVARMETALASLRIEAWPYAGPIGLREGEVLHVVQDWGYYGTVNSPAEVPALIAQGRAAFDFDIYKLLVRGVKRLPVVVPAEIIEKG